jgi:hypothetical protein
MVMTAAWRLSVAVRKKIGELISERRRSWYRGDGLVQVVSVKLRAVS